MAERYDDIGARDEPVKRLPMMRHGETYTVRKALGDLRGKAVLDLVCGSGCYTRMF